MEVFGTVKDGRVVLSPQMQVAKESYLRRMKDGTLVRQSITRVGRNKTEQQLGAHFGLMLRVILEEFENRGWDLQMLCPNVPPGIAVPKDMLKEYLYAVAGDVGDNGERKRISQMSTVEMSRHFEKCRDYVAAAWHIWVPDPDPFWKLKEQS